MGIIGGLAIVIWLIIFIRRSMLKKIIKKLFVGKKRGVRTFSRRNRG